MAKIRLGAKPKNFKRIVKFPMVDGSEGAIEITYKYRTRKEFGEFIDGILLDAETKPASDEDVKFSVATFMAKQSDSNADYIVQVAEGWNLIDAEDKPVEFTRENIQQLADEFPAAASAIMETYRLACSEGRLGN